MSSDEREQILGEFEALIQSELEDLAAKFGAEAAAEAANDIQKCIATRVDEWIFRQESRLRAAERIAKLDGEPVENSTRRSP